MEATLKRKIRRVAVVHLCLSAAAWIGVYAFSKQTFFWGYMMVILQPHLLLFNFAFLGNHLLHLPTFILILLAIGPIPVWSFCFGWIFVRLDGWLNHFPVLGRKVF
jgi:hypothetical protein